MRGSQLDKRITIEQKSVTQDPNYGTEVITWATLASRIPANVQDALPSKSESVANGIRIATQPARIRIRYRASITSDMRVTIHGATDRVCQIVGGPAEIGRREWLEMVVEAYSS
jgi:SPP1 family predicted phage head-tail adaptor